MLVALLSITTSQAKREPDFSAQDFAKYAGEAKKSSSADYYINGYKFVKFSEYASDENGYYAIYKDRRYTVDSKGCYIDEFGNKYVMVDNGYNIGDPEFNLEEVLLSTAWNYTGQKSKNIAYFNDFVSVEVGGYDVDLYAGGIAGKSNGLIKRYVFSSGTLRNNV